MTKYFHIVQVHPVYDGIVQTHKVRQEYEFDIKGKADYFIELYEIMVKTAYLDEKAVYLGCVNDETGELV